MCMNGVNSGKAKEWGHSMLTLSQAGTGTILPEGAETTRVSPNNNLSHERPTLDRIFQNNVPSPQEGNIMPKGRKWQPEEIEWLNENYELLGLRKCAEELNRSPSAIAHEAARLRKVRRGKGRSPRVTITDGYIWISGEYERFALHRRIMEMKLERKLSSKEIVHHKDGNSMNNDPDNLEVTTISEHNYKMHPKNRDRYGRFCQGDDIVRPLGKPKEMGNK